MLTGILWDQPKMPQQHFDILKTKILLLRVVSHTSCPCIRISAVNLWEGIFSHKNDDSLEDKNNGYWMYMAS